MRIAIIALTALLHQTLQPTFRSGVNFVELDVSVLDKDRLPVTGLTAADFAVLEDGVPQKVETFEAVVLPAPETSLATWWTSVAPDVERNAPIETGRLLILAIQEGVSPLHRVKEIARRVVESMGPEDRTALIDLASSTGSHEFTTDRARLLQAIDRMSGSPGVSLNAAGVIGAVTDPATADDRCGTVRLADALPLIRTLTEVARRTRQVERRRKTLFLIADSIPQIHPGNPCFNPWQELFAEAQRAHLNIYPVSPRGLQGMSDVTITSPEQLDLWRVVQRAQTNAQRTVAESTGGVAIVESNMFAENLRRAFADNRSYYVLGYHSTQKPTDRTRRRISVSVARDDVVVRTRSDYIPLPDHLQESARHAPVPSVVSALDAATRALLPATALSLDATALTFRTAEGVALAVVAAARPNVDAATNDQIQVRATLIDGRGEIRATAERRVNVTVGTRGQNAELRVPLFLKLSKAGRYQVRVAAHSVAANATGSVFLKVEVPDFAREPLWVSGVALRVAPDSPVMSLPQLDEAFSFLPSTRRVFRAGDRVEAAIRVYASRRIDAPIALTCRVIANGAVIDASEYVLQADAARTTAGAPGRCPVGVHDWPAGDYVLEIGARAASYSVAHKVRFSIE